MINKHFFSAKNIILTLLTTVAFILLCIPAFDMLGSILMPVVITVIGSMLISFILCRFKLYTLIGLSQIIFILFWIILAIVEEIQLQLNAGFVSYWIEFFYFDKLLVIGCVWLSSTLLICLNRITNDKTDSSEFKQFFRLSSVAFLTFYFVLLLYSFVLIRLNVWEYPFNFIPFRTVKHYIEYFNNDPYEVLMNILGNLFYFTPLGYILSYLVKSKNKKKRIAFLSVFPVIAFTLLEFSQYIFQNGYCEFDDMSMNSIGFWLGCLLLPLSNSIAEKLSQNRINSFWG